jgi:hypothetical protein
LTNGVKSIQESSMEESTFNARFSRGKKRYGDDPFLTLAEYREWTGGRGNKNFEDDPSAFADGLAWTLSPGMVVPAPQWHIAKGLRSENRHMPGAMTWIPLIDEARYLTIPLSASSAYDAAHIWHFIRRVGSPGTLTAWLCPDDAGKPGVATKEVTKTVDDITDYIDVFEDFAHDSPETFVADSKYYLVLFGGEKDNGDSCWEVGVERTVPGSLSSPDGITWTPQKYSMYYRVTDDHVARKFVFQTYGGKVYATSRPATGTSVCYEFDDTDTFEAAAGTQGLTIVSARPAVSNSVMYFPQGSGTNIRRWNGDETWDDDGTNKAEIMRRFSDPDNGPQVVRSLGNLVNFSDAKDWGSDLSFGDDVSCGDSTYPITNMIPHYGKFWVMKQDQIGIVSGGKYTEQESNYEHTPSERNGVAACSWNGLLYVSWLNSLIEIYGSTGDDVGQGWRGTGPGGNRMGPVSCVLGIDAWKFCGFDAGSEGYSSVQIFNGQTWHEIYRAPYGHRIRDLWWQYVDGGHARLFIDIDYDIVFLEFATDVANPTNDPTHNYAHSMYLVLSTFDDGAARLPKYIKSITASVSNCNIVQDTRVTFEIDYQVDNKVGLDGAENWRRVGRVFTSPEGTLPMNLGNKRCIRLRLRGYTDTPTVPPQIDAITIDGFTRTPARTIWTMRVNTGERAEAKKKASDLLKFLQEASISADDMTISSSIIPELNGRHVICTRPRVSRSLLNKMTSLWSGTIVISFMDMSE